MRTATALLILPALFCSTRQLQFDPWDVTYDNESDTPPPPERFLNHPASNPLLTASRNVPSIPATKRDSQPESPLKTKHWHLWKERLPEGYTSEERPDEDGPPTLINISMAVVRIHSISETDMSFGLDVYFREEWYDARLDQNLYINGTNDTEEIDIPKEGRDVIWRPDTFFTNAIHSDEEANGKNRFHFLLYPDGRLWHSRRITVVSDCPMSMVYYPFDVQGCTIKIGSYAYRARDLVFGWDEDHAVDIPSKITLPEFSVMELKTRRVTEVWPSGNYSVLEVCWVLKRSAGYCLVQLIIPAGAVVLCSWVALWLEEEATFNDIIAVVLAIIFLSYSQNSIMPRVSYIKLMDAYFGFCFTFTFFFLVKLVILKTVRRNWERKHAGANFQETLYQADWAHREDEGGKWCKDATICVTKAFHVLTQLLLPIIFGGFFFLIMVLLPYVNRGNPCW